MPMTGLFSAIVDAVDDLETLEFDNVVPMCDSRVMVFASLSGPDGLDVAGALDGLPEVSVKHCSTTPAAPGLYHVSFAADFGDSVLSCVGAQEAVPHRFVADGHRIRAVVTVEDWGHLRDLAGAIEREYGSFDLRGTTELDRPGYPLGRDKFEYGIHGKLTADQLEVLQTAYEMGHFAVPQQATSEEVAEELDIGRSTFSERLRRSENNLLRILFSDSE